jgi:hypothetical protein
MPTEPHFYRQRRVKPGMDPKVWKGLIWATVFMGILVVVVVRLFGW